MRWGPRAPSAHERRPSGGLSCPASLKDELLALEARQETLQTELTVEPDPAPLIHPNLAEVYRRKVAALHDALAGTGTRAEAFEAIRSLISAIVLTPENGELKTDLQGDIAHILTLTSESKKPAALGDGLIEQVKVVAGARNHLYRTLFVWVGLWHRNKHRSIPISAA